MHVCLYVRAAYYLWCVVHVRACMWCACTLYFWGLKYCYSHAFGVYYAESTI